MKKNSVMVKTVLMSMLTAATMGTMTSCSNDDDDLMVNQEVTNMVKPSVVKPISGVWYGCYKANGTAVRDNHDGKTLDYAHAYDVYEFNEDGTGSFHRHFIGEHANTPEIVFISVRRFWWFP